MPADPLPITLLDPADVPLDGSELLALVQLGRTLNVRADALGVPPANLGASYVVLKTGLIPAATFPIGISGDIPGSQLDYELDVEGDVLLLATFEVDQAWVMGFNPPDAQVHCRITWNTPNGPVPFGAADVALVQLHAPAAPGNPMNYGPSEWVYVSGAWVQHCNPGPVHFGLNVAPVLGILSGGFNRIGGLGRLVAVVPVKTTLSPSEGVTAEDGDDLTTEDGDLLDTEGS